MNHKLYSTEFIRKMSINHTLYRTEFIRKTLYEKYQIHSTVDDYISTLVEPIHDERIVGGEAHIREGVSNTHRRLEPLELMPQAPSAIEFMLRQSIIKMIPFKAKSRRNHWENRNPKNSIEHIVIHYTACNFLQTIDLFTNDKDKVSAHYVITEEEKNIEAGQIIQIVDDSLCAWHAGVSHWRRIGCNTLNTTTLNKTSIGIELINRGYVDTNNKRQWFPFHPQQINSCIALIKKLVDKYDIKPCNIVGHADITHRKVDPGPLFPWHKLYKAGIGAYIEYTPNVATTITASMETFLSLAQKYGYKYDTDTKNKVIALLKAFRAHFRSEETIQDIAIYNNPHIQDIDCAIMLELNKRFPYT